MNILNYIPKGKENAISRTELMHLTGLNDRKNRELIEQLKHQGHLICNLGTGYFIAVTLSEMLSYYKQETKRAMAILHPLKFFKKAIRGLGGVVK